MEDEGTAVVEETEEIPAEAETSEHTEVEGAEPNEEAPIPPADPAAELAKKESKVQKRIDQITKEKHEAKAEAEYWRKVATGEIVPQKPQELQPPPSNTLPDKPAVENFETYEEFVEALTDWKVDSREAAKQAQERQREAATRTQTVAEANAARIETARTTYDDFDEVVSNLNGIMVPPILIETLQESDISAELFYYLGNNIEETRRIANLAPAAQLKAIGRIEEKLEKKTPPPKPTVTKASSPITPVAGNAAPDLTDPNNLSDDEWLKREKARLQKLGRRY